MTRNKAEARRFRANGNDPRHGTHNGYVNLRCRRCPKCRRAAALRYTGRRPTSKQKKTATPARRTASARLRADRVQAGDRINLGGAGIVHIDTVEQLTFSVRLTDTEGRTFGLNRSALVTVTERSAAA